MAVTRLLVAAVWAFWAAGMGGRPLRAADEWQGTADEISRWIDELADPQFARREAAARSLARAGRPVLEPLVSAMGAGDLEVAARGAEIVRGMLDSEDADIAADAERALERLAEQGHDPVGHVAASVLEFHFLSHAAESRMHLESLGATIAPDPAAPVAGGLDVFLGPGWRGDGDDLRQLPRVRGVTRVRVHGVPVGAPAVAALGRLRGLRDLQLYGTGIDDDALRSLAARLPDAEIDVRKGGKLGVSATGLGGPCEIRHVQPGSAAELGGIRSGDVVVAIDGEPIDGFEALTARVGRHGPGETITLSIVRPAVDAAPQRLECTVRLDAW